MSAARQTRGRLDIHWPGLNISASPTAREVPEYAAMRLSIQRPGAHRTGQSVRGHVHCRHSRNVARIRRGSRRAGQAKALRLSQVQYCLPQARVAESGA